ncbi:hypothetical protein DY000_02024908 [Brassica cretica]|uniref:Reverse transcriptase zinc-binding domain-containing protein n=1 Tax=Brassica cretica TaxID=69181 RepID=A0ABQ7EAY9_BRACR|nr:hypothetical protein DY000_02024908 [Brassica cretica]
MLMRAHGTSKESGSYNSKSGYELAETLEQLQALPSPDMTCPRCGLYAEKISHVLFHCEAAKEAWSLSQTPLPPGGFSMSSVWLNFYHLMSVSKKLPPDNPSRLSFPWILWHLWKARNSLCFEQVQYDGSSIFNKASEESTIWLNAQLKPHDSSHVFGRDDGVTLKWQKPPMDSLGSPLFHSRRAFPAAASTLEADLYTLGWAVNALHDLHIHQVILEISSPRVLEFLFYPSVAPTMALGISRILRSLNSFDQCQLMDVRWKSIQWLWKLLLVLLGTIDSNPMWPKEAQVGYRLFFSPKLGVMGPSEEGSSGA